MMTSNKTAKRIGLLAFVVGALMFGTGCDELLGMGGDPYGGWGWDDTGYYDPYYDDTYYDPGFGGYGPIDPDVFQQSVDNFSDYLRS
jgi:hypothetical protein